MDIKVLVNEEKTKEKNTENHFKKHFSFLKTLRDYRDYGHTCMGYIYAFRAVIKFLDSTIKDFSESDVSCSAIVQAVCLELRKRLDNELLRKQRLLKFFEREYMTLNFEEMKKEGKKK